MLWFLERDKESLRIEIRYENASSEYVVIVNWPGGREQTHRFTDGEVCRAWLVTFENALEAERWKGEGPIILPYGWPDRRPRNRAATTPSAEHHPSRFCRRAALLSCESVGDPWVRADDIAAAVGIAGIRPRLEGTGVWR